MMARGAILCVALGLAGTATNAQVAQQGAYQPAHHYTVPLGAAGYAHVAKVPRDEREINKYIAQIMDHEPMVKTVVIIEEHWSIDRKELVMGELAPVVLDEYIRERVEKIEAMQGIERVIVKPKAAPVVRMAAQGPMGMPGLMPSPLPNPAAHKISPAADQLLHNICNGNSSFATIDLLGIGQMVMKQLAAFSSSLNFCTAAPATPSAMPQHIPEIVAAHGGYVQQRPGAMPVAQGAVPGREYRHQALPPEPIAHHAQPAGVPIGVGLHG